MANLSITNTFSTGATIQAPEFNTNFSDVSNYINNRNSGSSTWDAVYAASSSNNPVLRANNSTGTNSIFVAQDNGTTVLTVADGGAITITANGGTNIPLVVDNGSSTGDILRLQDNGTNVVQMTDARQLLVISSAANSEPDFSWIGDADTGINNPSANNINLICGGTQAINVTSSQIGFPDGSLAAPGISFLLDADTGLIRPGANRISLVTSGAAGLEINASQQAVFINGSLGTPSIVGVVGATTGIYFSAGSVNISNAASNTYQFTATELTLAGAGLISIGSATNYVNEVNYKTLTDRGCLGSFDDGVELQDGRKVSDCEAISSIKKHSEKKTIYGVPMLDYRTFPKVSYKKAEKEGKLLERNEKDEPIGGSDGVEMTSMQSIMLGAIKELHNRLIRLENV